jgi:hypothetical protein
MYVSPHVHVSICKSPPHTSVHRLKGKALDTVGSWGLVVSSHLPGPSDNSIHQHSLPV